MLTFSSTLEHLGKSVLKCLVCCTLDMWRFPHVRAYFSWETRTNECFQASLWLNNPEVPHPLWLALFSCEDLPWTMELGGFPGSMASFVMLFRWPSTQCMKTHTSRCSLVHKGIKRRYEDVKISSPLFSASEWMQPTSVRHWSSSFRWSRINLRQFL